MRKITLQIRKGTKDLVLGLGLLGILGLAAYKHTATAKNGAPALAFVGLVVSMKNRKIWDSATKETQEFAEAQDAALQEEFKHYIKSDELAAKIKEIQAAAKEQNMTAEQVKSFNEMLESVQKQAEKLQKLEDGGVKTDEKALNFYGKVYKALEENIEKLKTASESKSGSFQIVLKAAPDVMTTGYTTSAPNAYLPMPTVVPGVRETPTPEMNIMQIINVAPSDSPSITWVNELPVDGDAGYTAEGELKEQVSWKYVNETATSVKITAFIKVTTQALRNIKWLANRINTRLAFLVRNKMEDGLINGDGTPGTLAGIVSYAPGFTTTAFNNSVVDPQTVDAIVCMAGQIDQLMFTPDVVLMNPVDIRKMKLVKDKNGNYVMPPFTTTNGTYVDNMRVVANRKIAIGYVLVGDFMKSTAFIVEDLMLDIGLDADDFTKNRRTILAEVELGHFISAIEAGAFCYDALSVVKAAIATPGI